MTEVSSTRLYLGNLPRNGKRPIPTALALCASTCVLPRRAQPPPYRPLTSSLATKADVEAHFASHGTGDITEIKLMNGFGFIEYKDAMDARDVVPGRSPTNTPACHHTYRHVTLRCPAPFNGTYT
jgi:hypothetical protein